MNHVRATLPNGLRVLLVPDRGTPVVGVAVHYDVGFRSEPRGRTGFAHLFEHLMFQGSANLPRREHARQVHGAGGRFNGSAHADHTEFHTVVPSGALELALFLEADRMRAPALTAENLRNQVDVVTEIRRKVLDTPYGGFPWIPLPPLLYATFANAHNGFGEFADLERATVEDCAAFFDAFYPPNNAVLTVAGDLDPTTTLGLVQRHFADIPARDVPVRPSLTEPPPPVEVRGVHADRYAPLPALAIGYRLPDPRDEHRAYVACVVLAALLADGPTTRLVRRLVHEEPAALEVSAGCGLLGRPFDARDPDTMVVTAVHGADVDPERILSTVDAELADLAANGPARDELGRVASRLSAALHREHDNPAGRVLSYGRAEMLFGRPDLVAGLPRALRDLDAADIAAAAGRLRPDSRAVLTLVPSTAPEGVR